MACGRRGCGIKKTTLSEKVAPKHEATPTKMINLDEELKTLEIGQSKTYNVINKKSKLGFEKGYQRLTKTKDGYVYSYTYEQEHIEDSNN